MSFLRFWALIARGVGSGVIGVASRVRGDGVEGKARSWSVASGNLGRLREPVEGVAGVVVASLLVGLAVNAVDDEGVGGRAIRLVLRRTGRGKGVEGLLGIYWTAICGLWLGGVAGKINIRTAADERMHGPWMAN